ncbi:MAG TPA: ATP-binding protein [Steroidobacteraceae bacterium]|nr:ATP-binding protein [Steroidobacteraceae bacterium]
MRAMVRLARIFGLGLSATLLLLNLAAAKAGMSIEQWRAAADDTRALAENDVPRAYAQALRLRAALSARASREDQARALNLLARTEIYLGLTAQAAAHAEKALALARQSGDRKGQVEADLNLALTTVNLGRIDALSAVATDAVAALRGVNDPALTGEALLRASMMYLRLGRIDQAVLMSVRAEEIARRNGNPLALTYAAQGLGIAFGQSDHSADSRRYFTQMLQEARAAHSRLLEGDAVRSLADAADASGQEAKAEALLRQAIAIHGQAGATLSVNYGFMGLANFLHEHGRYHEAKPILDRVIVTYELYPTPIALWYALNARSANEQSLAELPAARADAERAYALAKRIGFPSYLSRSARRLGALAALGGDFRRAYQLSTDADAIANRSVETRMSDQMLELASRYEREDRQRQIEALTRRDQQQAAALRQRLLQDRLLLTMLLGAVLIAAITVIFMLRLRRLNANLERMVQDRTAELRQQASYLRTLIDTLPLRIWLKDMDSRYLAVNRAEAQASGRPVGQMAGLSDVDLWPPAIAEAHRAGDREVMSSRRLSKVEEAMPGKDGAAQWIETYRAPVLDDDGTLLGTVGASYDISERKAAEAAREAALAEAKRLVRLRSDFMAQMSHELRTPLNGILGYAGLLERDGTLSERQKGGVEVIRQSGEHLLGLINEVLDFARIESGKLGLDNAALALRPFLGSIAGLVAVRAQLKGLKFSLDTSAEVPEVILTDERRLRQVLLNLLANAVAFTDRGSVSLRVWRPEPQRLRFEVEDTGIGVPADQLEAIFQPFEQVAEGQRRGGTGLGLPISRRYVQLMGSDIEVASRIGVGSTFRFDLAIQATAAPADHVGAAPGTPDPAAAPVPEEGRLTPPPAEIERLHALALEGNMRDILHWAGQLTEIDGRRYLHFALHVRFLAERYQSQAILSLAKRCLGGPPDG